MATRPWYEIEDILRSKGFGGDDLFGFKQNYFDNLIEDQGYDPEDEELKRKRKLFLYGNEKEWELLKSAKSGLIRGLGEVPETAADVIEFGQKLIPGESENANAVEENLRAEAQRVRDKAGPFQPSSFQEKFVGGLGALPGTVASMVPISAPIAAATPALAAAVPALGATGAAVATGALGFGAYEAIRHARGTPGEMLKGFGEGAALGAITGLAGPLSRGAGKGVKNALLRELKGRGTAAALAGGGTGAFELATGASPEEAAQTAATFATLAALHRNMYNKVAKTAERAGVTDPKAHEQLFESAIQSEKDSYAYMAEKRKAKKEGREPAKTGAPTASQVAEELGVPFEAVTGFKDWGNRWKKVRNQVGSRLDQNVIVREKMKKLAAEERLAKEKDEPGTYDENGNLSQGFRDYWDARFAQVAGELKEVAKTAPATRQGAQYAITDGSGENPLYIIERVDWDRKSPNQFMVKDAQNPLAEPEFFKTLTEADRSIAKRLDADPEMPLGTILMNGMKYANADTGNPILDRLSRVYGRSMIHLYAKGMGKVELAESTKPMSGSDFVRQASEILEEPTTQAPIKARGRYSPKYESATLASLGDVEGRMHEFGHTILGKIFRGKFPRPAGWETDPRWTEVDPQTRKTPETSYNEGIQKMFTSNNPLNTGLKNLFDEEELQVLFGMGVKEQTPAGKLTPDELNPNASSYEAEGIAGYFRVKMYGLDPKDGLTDAMLNSDAGKRVVQKLEAMSQGLDPQTGAEIVPGLGAKFGEISKLYDLYRQQSPEQFTEAQLAGGRGGLLTHPFRELGKAFNQAWFNQTAEMTEKQKLAWSKISPGKAIPDSQNLEYITQFIGSSAHAQMGRWGMLTGNINALTGVIKMKPWTKAIAQSGLIDGVKGKFRQMQAVNHYVRTYRLAQAVKQIEAYKRSQLALTNPAIFVREVRAGRTPISHGEILAAAPYIAELTKILQKENIEVPEIRRGKPGFPVVESRAFEKNAPHDPVKTLEELNSKHPRAKSFVRWMDEFEAAVDLLRSPVDAGGTGPLKGFADFHPGVDMAERLRTFRKNRDGYGLVHKIRNNPLLKQTVEVPDYMFAGSRTLKAVDFWGIGKDLDPFTEYTMRLEAAQAEANHNRMMSQIYKIVGAQKRMGLNIGTIADTSEVEKLIKTGQIQALEKEMIVGFKHGGNKIYIKFNPETPEGVRMFKSVRGTGPMFAGNKLLDIALGGPKRMMVLGTTGANAGFLLYTNALRDTATSAIQSEIKGRRGLAGFGRTFKEFAPFLIKANKAIIFHGPDRASKVMAGRNPKYAEMMESYLRYKGSGATGATLIGEDIRNRNAAISEAYSRTALELSSMNNKKFERVMARNQLKWHMVEHPIDAMRQLLSVSEELNRFPEFYLSEKQIAKERGVNPEFTGPRPTKAAAEVSIDFKRAGIYSKLLNEMIPFFNPSLQGVDKFKRVLFNDKEVSLKNINKDALGVAAQVVTLPTLGLWLMNKDEEWYKELPTWEKLMFVHVKAADTVFRIPVPFEWGLFMGTLPVAIYDSMYNDAPERVKEQMTIALKQVVPYGFVDNIPQALKPMVEAVANKNFFTDIPIETKRMQGLLPTARFTENTLGIYKGAAKFASMLHAPELFQSPVMIEHLTRGYFGSVVNGLLHDIEAAATLDPSRASRGLILSRMISDTDRPGQSVQDFYKKLDVADKAWKTAKRRIEEGDKASAAKILNKYKSNIGLTAQEIRQIIISGNTQTPPTLLDMHRKRLEMSELKKKEEDKAMTETAQAALGRDWE